MLLAVVTPTAVVVSSLGVSAAVVLIAVVQDAVTPAVIVAVAVPAAVVAGAAVPFAVVVLPAPVMIAGLMMTAVALVELDDLVLIAAVTRCE